LQAAYHRLRRAEGLSAWSTPNIVDWRTFARSAWENLGADGRVLMNSAQEQALWTDIIRDERQLPTALDASVQRLAALAMEAHDLLCSYSPIHLRTTARSGWDRDASAFSQWLASFDEVCRQNNLLSASRLPLELIARLRAGTSSRPPLLAVGFDRLLPVQREAFDAWGEWHAPSHEEQSAELFFHAALDSQSELEACAYWCNRQIATHPEARLLVITQDIAAQRGQIERAFLRFSNSLPNFEFSLGTPLAQVPQARGALLLLRLLHGTINEDALDWLISSRLMADSEESAALEVCMRLLRRKGLQRTQWTLRAFLDQPALSERLPRRWGQRMIAAHRQLRDSSPRLRGPLEWADSVPHLLEMMGWPGDRAQESADFQAIRRWQQALDLAGSLGFDGRHIDWPEFLAVLETTLRDTLFAPESLNAPIQIAGPAESAGLTADAIWFLGAGEDSWPAVGSMNPLLPTEVQRDAAMPHASPRFDWELSDTITKRVVASAPVVHFSYAEQTEGVDTRPSRLISKLAGTPQKLSSEMVPPAPVSRATTVFKDFSEIAFRRGAVHGGSRVLTHQSQCPFKAFAVARLGAEAWDPAEFGLTPAQRGQILHAILRSIWSGPPGGLRSLDDLIVLPDREAFIERHVQAAMRDEVPASTLECMPRRYLALEEMRLVRLVSEWLMYEAERVPFSVAGTEVDRTINLAGLTLKLRIDRIDRLNDGSPFVIDYKTGDISPKAWDPPRPDDVQLPLYAGFALDQDPGGLAFAKLRAFDWEFTGSAVDARASLLAGLSKRNALVKDPLTPEKLREWRMHIESLARDFVAGRSAVDPRDYPKTCERCGLQTICRIQEQDNHSQLETDDESIAEEAMDE
jgi:probable DNA repair protein